MPTSLVNYGSVAVDGLSLIDINVSEIDTGNYTSFNDSGPIVFGISSGAYAGVDFAAFDSTVTGAGSSESLTFTFNVSAATGNVISAMSALYLVDQFAGTGTSLTATESAYDTSGNLLGTQSFIYGQTAAGPVTLATAQQTVNVTLTLTESISAAGSAASAIDMSGLEALFAQTAAPVNTASIGDQVFLDLTGSGLESGFNAGPGFPGVTVELLDGTGTSVLATTTTDSLGQYSFSSLAAGTYEVAFIAPTGYTFSPQGVGGSADAGIDSSPNATTGITGPITLTAGQVDNNVEAGLVPPGSAQQGSATLGDYVWFDANGNGLIDSGETGVGGVTVDLLNAAGTSVLSTTTTTSSGYYSFTNLTAGTYAVQFVAPSGDGFTTQGVGTNPALDSSANATTGITAPVTLTAGQVDNNVEAGLMQLSSAIGVLKLPATLAVGQGGSETYSFTVTNTGNTALTNVTVVDNIGTAAQPVNVTPTLVTSGTNGTLAPGASWTYTQTVSAITGDGVSAGSLTANAILKDFNAVIYGNGSTPSDIQGAAVIGGNFSGATVDSSPSGSLPTGFGALTVFGSTSGNAINLNNGGKAYVGGTKGAKINFNGGGSYIAAPSTTISALQTTLNALSTSLSQLAATGTLPATGNNEVIKATPGANGIAVIDLTAAQLAAIPSFTVNLNGASSLIFNVNGSSANFNANDESGTTGAGNIIWNFYNATGTVALNTQIGGTVLAPAAKVTNSNQVDGFLVAKTWTGSGELHDIPFIGALPSNPANAAAADTVTVTATGVGGAAVTATDTKEVEVLGSNSNISVNGTVPTGVLSTLYGTPQTLEFLYSPGNSVSAGASGTVTGTNSAASAFMVVENAAGTAIYFEGSVTSGEKIYADSTINPLTNTLLTGANFANTDGGQSIFALVYASQAAFQAGSAPIQTNSYGGVNGTMHFGDTIGSVQLVGYVGATGGHLSN